MGPTRCPVRCPHGIPRRVFHDLEPMRHVLWEAACVAYVRPHSDSPCSRKSPRGSPFGVSRHSPEQPAGCHVRALYRTGSIWRQRQTTWSLVGVPVIPSRPSSGPPCRSRFDYAVARESQCGRPREPVGTRGGARGSPGDGPWKPRCGVSANFDVGARLYV